MFERHSPSDVPPRAGFLTERDRGRVIAYLRSDPKLNLQLLDLLDRDPTPGDVEPVVLVAWHDDEVVGVAALRPSLLFDGRLSAPALEAFLPFLDPIETGLLKSLDSVVTELWTLLERAGRRTLIDRYETAFVIRPGELVAAPLPQGASLRRALETDLDALVYAARASLREEQRPDPGARDPEGFERWVRSRLARARVVEYENRLVFVAYADVQRAEGWLVQGVFTWPDMRRSGFGAAGMRGVVREAFEEGADHVQLAVIDGNDAGIGLYRDLGFCAFARLRTVLFVGGATRRSP